LAFICHVADYSGQVEGSPERCSTGVRGKIMDDLIAAASQFNLRGSIAGVQEFGSGNINGTFLVTSETEDEAPFVLQRINTQVFHQPEILMANLRAVSGHVQSLIERNFPGGDRRWEIPHVIPARQGLDCWRAPDGAVWRALSFIATANSFDTINDEIHATEVGYAVGMFQRLLIDLPQEALVCTLEGFHDTPFYLQRFEQILSLASFESSSEMDFCSNFIAKRRGWASVLENAKAEGKLRARPIHGDPKVNNVMLDADTKKAVGMVDLDTVMPGLVHYDIGDCLRSSCNPFGEEAGDWESIRFDTDMCRAVLSGYFSVAGNFLDGNDHEYFFDATRLIAFELGVRFLTDHLEGDVYFKGSARGQNLKRALVQFKLTESIEAQESVIRTILGDLI